MKIQYHGQTIIKKFITLYAQERGIKVRFLENAPIVIEEAYSDEKAIHYLEEDKRIYYRSKEEDLKSFFDNLIKKEQTNLLLVQENEVSHLVHLKDIEIIHIKSKKIYIETYKGRHYSSNDHLIDILYRLVETCIQINQYTIIKKEDILSIERIGNQKFEITTKTGRILELNRRYYRVLRKELNFSIP